MSKVSVHRAQRLKYGNQKTMVDGFCFDSKKEAARYGVLKLHQLAGEIQGLRLQVPYLLTVNGQIIAKYIADFVYTEKGKEVIEDTKGFKTPEYKLKKRLMLAVHGIVIKES